MTDIRYMIIFQETRSPRGKRGFVASLMDGIGQHVGTEDDYAFGFSQRHAVKCLQQSRMAALSDEQKREAKRACRRWLWSEKNRIEVIG